MAITTEKWQCEDCKAFFELRIEPPNLPSGGGVSYSMAASSIVFNCPKCGKGKYEGSAQPGREKHPEFAPLTFALGPVIAYREIDAGGNPTADWKKI